MPRPVTPLEDYSELLERLARFRRRVAQSEKRDPAWKAEVEKTFKKLTDLLNNPRNTSTEQAPKQTESGT